MMCSTELDGCAARLCETESERECEGANTPSKIKRERK